MWNPNRRRWDTAASAVAWTKPAVAVVLPALKVPVVGHAAVCSRTATAAHLLPGQRRPAAQEARIAKESFGNEGAAAAAVKAKLKWTRHKATQMLSCWSSAAQTRPSSTRHLWAAACRQWPTHTAVTSHQSSAAQTPKTHDHLNPPTLHRWTFSPPAPRSATPPSHPCLRWSTTAWSTVRPRVATQPSPTACRRHLHLHRQTKEGGKCFCTSAKRTGAASRTLSWWKMQRYKRPPKAPAWSLKAQQGSAVYRQRSNRTFWVCASSVSLIT